VHELEAPNEFTLTLALDVIEDILNFLYALDYKVSLLDKLKGKQTRVRGSGRARNAMILTRSPIGEPPQSWHRKEG